MSSIKVQLWYNTKNNLQKDTVFESEHGLGYRFHAIELSIQPSLEPLDGYFRLVIVLHGHDQINANAAVESLTMVTGACSEKGTT